MGTINITQCTDIQTAMAFALILLGNISGSRRTGTGPAPSANVKTNLHIEVRGLRLLYEISQTTWAPYSFLTTINAW